MMNYSKLKSRRKIRTASSFFFLTFLCLVDSFVLLPLRSQVLLRNIRIDAIDKKETYNDDAFGLVFLGSIFIAKDTNFAACFGLFSFIAVILTRINSNLYTPLLPGFVAAISFLATSISLLLNGINGEEAIKVDFILCVVSCLWLIVHRRSEQNRKS